MSNKIQEFVKRNRYRNKHLYEDDVVEGFDYIVCPVSGERLSMIKSSYIERVLELTVDEYDKLYPNVRGVCERRIKNIKKGLQKIDDDTGLTKHELSVVKSRETLTEVGIDGVTGDERRAIKTRESNTNNIDERGMNGYHRTAEKARPKQIETLSKQGKIARCGCREEWVMYRRFVDYLTKVNRKYVVIPEGITIGVYKGQYNLDHIYSVCASYNNHVSPYLVSKTENLRYILSTKNTSKFTSCDIEIEDLLNLTGYTKDRCDTEYRISMDVIREYIRNNNIYSMYKLNKSVVERLNNGGTGIHRE